MAIRGKNSQFCITVPSLSAQRFDENLHFVLCVDAGGPLVAVGQVEPYGVVGGQDGTVRAVGLEMVLRHAQQRLAIARTVYRDPEIYIFDDSFSALDYKTDQVLRAALKRETGEATSLIVAQRIGTIRDADRIIVLDEGKMVGQGTHKELMKTCAVYQEIAYSQLSKEELENE